MDDVAAACFNSDSCFSLFLLSLFSLFDSPSPSSSSSFVLFVFIFPFVFEFEFLSSFPIFFPFCLSFFTIGADLTVLFLSFSSSPSSSFCSTPSLFVVTVVVPLFSFSSFFFF